MQISTQTDQQTSFFSGNKKWLLITVLIFTGFNASATHIVGGEMTYQCLGNDNYLITLTVFRDCFNGEPPFDNPASIGAFDINGNLMFDLLLNFNGSDTLEPILSGNCFVVPPNVCVEQTQYQGIFNLPPIPGGYILSYQRCCRNFSILNIVNPLATGATYGVAISQASLEFCNNSAVFNEWPPIYICVNEPISFDQSATDPDGDVLVYHLCTPIQGADQDFPMPQPPNPPPYDEVVWNSPYDLTNMLGGVPLSIDPVTGLLTGTPNTIGQFVVGICVDEYRDGVLISTTTRDFQFNVGVCGVPTAAFSAPEIQCGNLSVAFDNQSASTDNYLWIFNDPGNPGATSTQTNPVFTFSDTGFYNVMLITEPNTVCSDTFVQTIYLAAGSLLPAFDYTFGECSDSLDINIINNSEDTIYGINSWEWQLSLDDIHINETGPDPDFTVGGTGDWILELTVTSNSGCVETISDTIEVDVITDMLPGDSIGICSGDSVVLNINPDLGNIYQWSPPEGLSSTSIASPTALPEMTTTYVVTITSSNGFCQFIDSVTVVLPTETLTIQAPEDTITCENIITLSALSNQSGTYTWASDPGFNNIIGNQATVDIETGSPDIYYVMIENNIGCTAIDSFMIESNGVSLDIPDLISICSSDTLTINAVNLNPSDDLVLSWSPQEGIISGGNTLNPVVDPDINTEYSVIATNQYGCSETYTVNIEIDSNFYDLVISADPDTILLGGSSQLMVTPLDELDYYWSPDATLSNAFIYNPVATPMETTLYTVNGMDMAGCQVTLSVLVVVLSLCEEPFIFIPNAFTPNNDSNNDFWKVWGNGFEAIRILVYDRWGEEVFATTDLTEVWDGTFKGKELPPDAYGYYVRVECFGGLVYEKKGNVSIIR